MLNVGRRFTASLRYLGPLESRILTAYYHNSSDGRSRESNGQRDRKYQSNYSNNRNQYNNNRYRQTNGQQRNNNWGNRRGQSKRSDRDDDMLIRRNHTQKSRANDDGLMGLENYAIDEAGIKDLKYEDLLPSQEGEGEGEKTKEVPSGMSPIPTNVLADKKLVYRPLVNSLIHNRHYEWLTPVQAQTLLPILKDESVVVRAKTGTGKTAAFVIPAIQKVLEARARGLKNKVLSVIISPTRELAQQIADEAFKITQFGGLRDIKVQSLVGGLSKAGQMREAGLIAGDRGTKQVADIIVATPGRLLDVLDEPDVLKHFDCLKFRVFDEADRLLDTGFEAVLQDIRQLLETASPLGKEVPLLLFSATADNNVRRFARSQFGDRVRVVDTVPKDEPTANELVDQYAVVCPTWKEAFEGAAKAITDAAVAEPNTFKAVVFLPTVAMVDNFEKIIRSLLPRSNPVRQNTSAIHGQRTQANRQRRADEFRKNPSGILITTDVVARGMDFPLVSHVYQIGVPPDVPSYVHRIGRTARIGNSGISVLFYTNHVRGYIEALNREGIKPKQQLYEPDTEFNEKFSQAAENSVSSDDEAQEMLNSMLSYMSVLKSRYNVPASQFLSDMQPVAELYGLESLKLSRSNSDTWERNNYQSYNKRNRNFQRRSTGSSRRSRFRF